MCNVCGCGHGEVSMEGKDGTGHHHDHDHPHGHDHDHRHDHHHHGDTHDYGAGPAGAAAPGMSQARMIKLEQDILAKNNGYAEANRALFAERGILALNLVSSPGSGKTSLLVKTIEALGPRRRAYVIEGDQQTSADAERIRATGAPAIQINTGKGCHLDAHMVGHALEHLDPEPASLVFIENVGNLVCPAAFDLGEAHKVAILSVTEGDDKPLKYPDMFAASDLMLLNKIDLLAHVDFDVEQASAHARKVNRGIKVLKVSARSGEGLGAWIAWIEAARAMALAGHPLSAAG